MLKAGGNQIVYMDHADSNSVIVDNGEDGGGFAATPHEFECLDGEVAGENRCRSTIHQILDTHRHQVSVGFQDSADVIVRHEAQQLSVAVDNGNRADTKGRNPDEHLLYRASDTHNGIIQTFAHHVINGN